MEISNQLIEDCIGGDRISQTRLYENLLPLMKLIANKYTHDRDTAIDSINKAFLKIINNLPQYNHVDKFESWASVIIRNAVIDSYRYRISRQKLVQSMDSIQLGFHVTSSDYNNGLNQLLVDDINKVVNELPTMTRSITRMHLFDGYSHKEIGDKLNVSEEVSRWHLHKARKFLKKNLNF